MASDRLSLVPILAGLRIGRLPSVPLVRGKCLCLVPRRCAGRCGRRPGLRFALVRQRLAEGWPRLMLAKFGDDQACADFFGRTRQAASYWRSGHCKPDDGALALAWLRWPEDCAAMCGGAAPVARKDGV